MIKEEKFTTELGFSFELSEHDTLQFTREEVAELIYILQLYYERMD
jgi:hypothetical protein